MVFAITLPYTNPFKFNHYTVSLAHHVIIMWFLKCRLANRKDFVKFILKGLNSNILQPFEEGNFRTREERNLASLNQDSSSRKRSSSLKEETPSRRVRHMTGVSSRPNLQKPNQPDERQVLLTFHQELTETCQDLMARYVTHQSLVSTLRNAQLAGTPSPTVQCSPGGERSPTSCSPKALTAPGWLATTSSQSL